MGDLGIDSAVTGRDGRYSAELSPEWGAWGPNGGYLAAIALRAAHAHGSLPRVASLTCHFLSVARFERVELAARALRTGRRAESIGVSMSQQGRPVLEALAWLAADSLDGLAHDAARMPEVPGPGELRSFEELVPEDADPPLPMWRNIEGRPTIWYDDAADRPPSEPYANGWYRFRPGHGGGPLADLARQLILLDVMAFSAVWQAHRPDSGVIAPNLDLSVQFHRSDPREDGWFFAEGFSDVAQDGLIGFRTRLWSGAGRLLASGSGQLVCSTMR